MASPLDFMEVRFAAEPFAWYVDGGVVLPPTTELRVEDDLVVGTVP